MHTHSICILWMIVFQLHTKEFHVKYEALGKFDTIHMEAKVRYMQGVAFFLKKGIHRI